MRERHENSRSRTSPPRVNVPAPVVAATAEEAANLQLIRFLKGGTPPEGSGINEVFKATNELYAHVMARVGSEPNIRPLQRSTSEGSSLRSRSVPGRRLQPLGPRRKRRKAASVEDGLPSPGADLLHLRAIGASESTWHESVRRSAMESWRESCSVMRATTRPSGGAAVASRRLAGQALRGWRQRPRRRRRRRKRRDWRQRRRRRRRRRGRRGWRQRRTALTFFECPCSRSAAGVHPRDTPPRAILVGNSTGRLKADEIKSC